MSFISRGMGDYNGAGTITRYDGSIVSDPANTPPGPDDCIPFMCGADPNNQDARYWCAYWGRSGNRACIDPSCKPFLDRIPIPGCHIVAPPTETPHAPIPQPAVIPPMLTPANVIPALPDITQANAPAIVQTPDPSCWCQLNAAINANPLLALGILAGVAFLAFPKGGR